MIYKTLEELPIDIWFEIHRTGNMSLLIIKTKTKKKFKHKPEELVDAWEAMYNEYLKRWGLDNGALDQLKVRIRIAKLKAQWIKTREPYYKTLIEIEEQSINFTQDEEDDSKNNTLDMNLAKLGKYYGYMLHGKTTSTSEYYSHLYNAIDGKVRK